MKPRRSAGLIERGSALIVFAMARAVSWVRVTTGPAEVLEVDAEAGEVGAAIRRALAAFKTGVPDPDPKAALDPKNPLLAAAKVKSWSELARGAKEVSITQDAHNYQFLPTENLGGSKGFVSFSELDVVIPSDASNADIGKAARKALELSK